MLKQMMTKFKLPGESLFAAFIATLYNTVTIILNKKGTAAGCDLKMLFCSDILFNYISLAATLAII